MTTGFFTGHLHSSRGCAWVLERRFLGASVARDHARRRAARLRTRRKARPPACPWNEGSSYSMI
jgi:hypothetical protein